MIDISARNLTKAYGSEVILEGISFHVNQRDRVGIIGINGAGKTTLLNVLSGQIPADEGDCFIASDKKLGYLKQDAGLESELTVIEQVRSIFAHFPDMERQMEEMLEKAAIDTENSEKLLEKYHVIRDRYEWMGGYSYESEMRGILASMAFGEDMYEKKISTLSGGEKTRLALALLLLEKPDILFLDEPTNHLDIGTLKWLEQYLKEYRGTIVVVSHDRYFLDQTVTRIFEVENRRLNIYEGNYRSYAAQRKERRQSQLRAYEKQQKEIARQEEMIRRFKQRGTEKLAKRALSREKRLDAMERLDRPEGEGGRMKITFHQNYRSGGDVLAVRDLAAGFGYGRERRELYSGLDMDIRRGERVCIVGDNGTGKTTLLRQLVGEMSVAQGKVRLGHNVQIGYYDQSQQRLDDDNTVIEELQDAYHLYSEGELRNILGRFLFRGEQVFLKVGELSGGERARLALLKLMMSGANMLVMDEPTNHLDVESKEIFEDALLEFPGTCLIVSHDRYFLNRIPTRIMELTPNGLVNFLGKYDYYVEKKQEMIASGRQYLQQMSGQKEIREPEVLSSADRRKLQKEKEARERRIQRQRKALEEEIGRIEEEIEEVNRALTDPAIMADHVRLSELSESLDELKTTLDQRYESWLELQE